MKKLALDLEHLQVETFDTLAPAAPEAGTVLANGLTNECATNRTACCFTDHQTCWAGCGGGTGDPQQSCDAYCTDYTICNQDTCNTCYC